VEAFGHGRESPDLAEADKAAADRIVGWYLSTSGEREAFVAVEWHEPNANDA
jgi:hypothetical protein